MKIDSNIELTEFEKEIFCNIKSKMTESLSEIEKARYIYLELGKIFCFDIKYYASNYMGKYDNFYYHLINSGTEKDTVCAAIAKTLTKMLNAFGINAKTYFYTEFQHADTIMVDREGKKYLLDLTADLKNISYGFTTNHFCKKDIPMGKLEINADEFSRIEDERIHEIDNKLKYTILGLYTDDFLAEIRKEFSKSEEELEKTINVKYDKELSKSDNKTKGKIDFIIENIFRYLRDENCNIGPLEITRACYSVLKQCLTNEELRKVSFEYFSTKKDYDNSSTNVYMKLNLGKTYIYMFSKEEDRFINISQEEMQNKKEERIEMSK